MCAQSLSRVQLFTTSWMVAHQVPLSMGFSRQEYWTRLPFSFPGGLANPGIEPAPLASPTLAGGFITTELPGKPGIILDWKRFIVHSKHSDFLKKSFSKTTTTTKIIFLATLPNPNPLYAPSFQHSSRCTAEAPQVFTEQIIYALLLCATGEKNFILLPILSQLFGLGQGKRLSVL